MTSGLYGSNFTSYAKASVGIYGFSIVHICFGGRTGRKIGQKLETQATSLTHLIRFCLDGVVKVRSGRVLVKLVVQLNTVCLRSRENHAQEASY